MPQLAQEVAPGAGEGALAPIGLGAASSGLSASAGVVGSVVGGDGARETGAESLGGMAGSGCEEKGILPMGESESGPRGSNTTADMAVMFFLLLLLLLLCMWCVLKRKRGGGGGREEIR